MKLHTLKPAAKSTKKRKRVGRGAGSGKGGTSTRGHKGAQSRSGYSRKRGFEGGQMPLQRRIPKFGFKPINRTEYKAINLVDLQKVQEKTQANAVNVELLVNNGLAAKKDLVKILGKGEISVALEVTAHAFSKSAKKAIEDANGKVILIDKKNNIIAQNTEETQEG